MTVPTSTAKSGPYAGAGTVGPFTVGFRFLEDSHLQVIRTSSTGVDTTLALTTDYSASGAGGVSGSVTLVTALAVGQQLTVIRNVPFTQDADYVQNDAFPAESHERSLDKLTMQTQQLLEAVDRAAKLPVTSTADSEELVADITLLADNIENLTAVYSAIPAITVVANDLSEPTSEIETVAGSIVNVDAVGTNIANVNAVAGNEVNIDAVAGNATNINAAVANATNINAVAANEANINTVAGIDANVTTVAGIAANVSTVAGIAPAVSTVAGISAAVSTVSGINAAVSTVSGNTANIDTVAAVSGNVTTVAGSIAAVNTNATNIVAIQNASANADAAALSATDAAASLDLFKKAYQGAYAGDPATRYDGSALQTGDLAYNTLLNKMRVYATGTGWQDVGVSFSPVGQVFSGTGSQTAFTLSGSPGVAAAVIISVGGVVQKPTVDYTVSGTTLTFLSAPPSGTDNISAINFGVAGVVNVPATNSVGASALQSGAAIANIGFTPADAAATVNLTGDQTVAGVKTFSSAPVMAVTGLSGDIAAARIVSALNATGAAPVYACRAWVNFNGTGTVAIRASGNVSSITDNGTGDYTVNFTTAMPDANYCPVSMSASASGETTPRQIVYKGGTKTTGALQVASEPDSGTNVDVESVFISIFR